MNGTPAAPAGTRISAPNGRWPRASIWTASSRRGFPQAGAGPAQASPPLDAEDKLGGNHGTALYIFTNRGVDYAVANHVDHDLAAGYEYLPERDADVLRCWLDNPYCI